MRKKTVQAVVCGPLSIDPAMRVQNLGLLSEMLGKRVRYIRRGKAFQATVSSLR